MLKSFCIALAVALGLAALANGVYMLLAPESWYFAVPGVTTTGPFNQHFVRDIGLIFLLLGDCLSPRRRAAVTCVCWCGERPRSGFPATPCFTSGRWQSASVPRQSFRVIFWR